MNDLIQEFFEKNTSSQMLVDEVRRGIAKKPLNTLLSAYWEHIRAQELLKEMINRSNNPIGD